MTRTDALPTASVDQLLEKLDGVHRRITERALFGHQPTRSFLPTDVEPAVVRRLVRAATMAPTAQHRSPWAFAIVQDREVLRRYAAGACAMSENQARASAHNGDDVDDVFAGAGTLLVICSRLQAPAGTSDCWLAAENVMLAAHALRLGSRRVDAALPWLNTAAVKRELQIPDDATAIAAIVVGVPAERTSVRVRQVPQILAWKRVKGVPILAPDVPRATRPIQPPTDNIA